MSGSVRSGPPHDDVTGGDEHRLPQRLALAVALAEVGEHGGGIDDRGAGVPGPAGRVVGGVVVDHDDLVDHRVSLDELGPHGLDDRADRGRLVAGGQADTDRRVTAVVGQ
jgi:hypothetical protein